MHNVTDIQWINLVLNVGVLPLMALIYKLDKSIDKLRLDITQQFVTKAEFDEYRREHRRDMHND